jgi:hypothetical protein
VWAKAELSFQRRFSMQWMLTTLSFHDTRVGSAVSTAGYK